MWTVKITSGPLPHYTWIPPCGTGIPTEEEKVCVSLLSMLPWGTSSPKWQSVPRVLQSGGSLFCLLTRLTGTKATPQHQHIRMCEMTSAKKTEGYSTPPEVLRVKEELIDVAMAPLPQHTHSTPFQAEPSLCRCRGREEEKLCVNSTSPPPVGVEAIPFFLFLSQG